MGNIMTEANYRERWTELRDRFSKEFMQKHLYKDPCFRRVYEELLRGADPYKVIELLISGRQELLSKVKEVMEQTPLRLSADVYPHAREGQQYADQGHGE